MAQASHHRALTLPQIWMPVCSALLGQAASGVALPFLGRLANASFIMQTDAASCQGWPADLGCPQPLLSAKELPCRSQHGGLEEHPQASAIA